jgi:hypothetical protein
MILEIMGQSHGSTDAKHQAAQRWVSAANNWGKPGKLDLMVCRNPQNLGQMLNARIGLSEQTGRLKTLLDASRLLLL